MIQNRRFPTLSIFAGSMIFLITASTLNAQTITMPGADIFALPTAQGCSSQIAGAKPKIYIANFLVTYGKKTMGRLIADNIAFRFESDDRFELVSRKTIDKEMSSLFKKKLKAEEYLNLAVSLAAEHQADCVIFGKIGKTGGKISFLVRMAAVATGENKIKVDEDVDRKEASAFFERTGESLVAYFNAAPPPVVAEPPKKTESKGVLAFWGGYNFFFPDSQAQRYIDIMKTLPNSTNNQGGISGGADLWIRATNGVDVGLGLGYVSLWQYKFSYTSGGSTLSYDESIRMLPIIAQLRFISGAGLYLSFGAGYFVGIGEGTVTVNGIKSTASASNSSFGVNAALGWQIKLGEGAVFNLGAKFWYVFVDGTGPQITPFAGFGFRF